MSRPGSPQRWGSVIPLIALAGVYLLVLVVVLLVSIRRLSDLGLLGAPRALWAPFARPLLGVAFEMALEVGLPAALLGARALGLALRWIALAAAFLVGVSWAAVSSFEAGALSPGQLVQELIDRGRSSCFNTAGRRVDVPLVGATWTCPEGKQPTLSGGTRLGAGTTISASAVRVSPDLRQLELVDLETALPKRLDGLSLHLRARRATVAGLPPWGRPADSPTGRRLVLATLAAALTLVAALVAQGRLRTGFVISVGMGIAAGASLVAAQRALDRFGAGLSSYALAVIAGPSCIAVLFFAVLLLKRFRNRA